MIPRDWEHQAVAQSTLQPLFQFNCKRAAVSAAAKPEAVKSHSATAAAAAHQLLARVCDRRQCDAAIAVAAAVEEEGTRRQNHPRKNPDQATEGERETMREDERRSSVG